MSIIDDLDQIQTQLDQITIAREVSSNYRSHYNVLKTLDAKTDMYADENKFDQVPVVLREAIGVYRQILKTFLSQLESNADIVQMVNWVGDGKTT
jgi:hypothetical protein